VKLPQLNIPAIQVTKNVNLSYKNFSKPNTPPKLQKWANRVLKLAALGLLVGGTMSAKPFSDKLPPDLGLNIMLYSGSIGTLFKNASKLFGIKTDE
jgi:hypothetical protein